MKTSWKPDECPAEHELSFEVNIKKNTKAHKLTVARYSKWE